MWTWNNMLVINYTSTSAKPFVFNFHLYGSKFLFPASFFLSLSIVLSFNPPFDSFPKLLPFLHVFLPHFRVLIVLLPFCLPFAPRAPSRPLSISCCPLPLYKPLSSGFSFPCLCCSLVPSPLLFLGFLHCLHIAVSPPGAFLQPLTQADGE